MVGVFLPPSVRSIPYSSASWRGRRGCCSYLLLFSTLTCFSYPFLHLLSVLLFLFLETARYVSSPAAVLLVMLRCCDSFSCHCSLFCLGCCSVMGCQVLTVLFLLLFLVLLVLVQHAAVVHNVLAAFDRRCCCYFWCFFPLLLFLSLLMLFLLGSLLF